MRPTPGELAHAIRAMLREAGGELQNAAAKAQMRRVMYVLKGARWDDAAFDLLRENEVLRAGLEALGSGTASPESIPRDFAQANARNLELRTGLAAALEGLRDRPLAESAAVRRALALQLLERP